MKYIILGKQKWVIAMGRIGEKNQLKLEVVRNYKRKPKKENLNDNNHTKNEEIKCSK